MQLSIEYGLGYEPKHQTIRDVRAFTRDAAWLSFTCNAGTFIVPADQIVGLRVTLDSRVEMIRACSALDAINNKQ